MGSISYSVSVLSEKWVKSICNDACMKDGPQVTHLPLVLQG